MPVAAKIVPPILRAVARTRSPELFFGVVLAICLGTAALTQAVGLSPALGAFVAGLMISESAYAQEALAHLFPVRDSFVALFFVTMGLLVDPKALISNLPLLAAMVGFDSCRQVCDLGRSGTGVRLFVLDGAALRKLKARVSLMEQPVDGIEPRTEHEKCAYLWRI